MEKMVYAQEAKTPEQRVLVARSRHAWLTSKLVDFSLTPEEWNEYVGAHADNAILELESFEDFYKEAQSRDAAMAANLITGLGADHSIGSPVAILVTGGFHAEGMTEKLTQVGISVISYVPKIEKSDAAQGSNYLSIFTQEKTPLEKLFQGNRLFLAYNPAPPALRRTILPALVAMATVALFGNIAGFDPSTIYHTLGGIGVLAVLKATTDFFVARIETQESQVKVAVSVSGEKIQNTTEAPVTSWLTVS